MKRTFPGISLLLLFTFPTLLLAWDADDETFDPTIKESIIDGSSRIGDPSPVYREGYEERGFTYVGSSVPEKGDPTVNLSLILPPDPDDPANQLGGSLYLPVETAQALVKALEQGADLPATHMVLENGWNGTWTLDFDKEKGLVFQQDYQEKKVKFFLSIPAAKKLAGALQHSIGEVKKVG